VGVALRPTAKALPGQSRTHNKALVLRTLFHDSPLSRADLARRTKLTRVSISDLIAELIEAGLVEELGPRTESRIGKPAALLGLDAAKSAIVAIDLSNTETAHGAVLNLRGEPLAKRKVAIGGATGQQALTKVSNLAKQLISQAKSTPVIGLGVASPGIVTQTGTVEFATDFEWRHLPLAEHLAKCLGIPCHVGNDANLRALAEFTFGGASAAGLMVITIERGLGAGILLDGVLLQGRSFAAGEIGHLSAMVDGDRCVCGRYGCLETVLSKPALQALGTAAATANPQLDAVGQAAAVVLAPIASALNLTDLVFCDPSGLVTQALLDAIGQAIAARVLPTISADLTIRISTLGGKAALLGATALVLSEELGIT
jgi:predicted NBD/HSP70 family sugar kinase